MPTELKTIEDRLRAESLDELRYDVYESFNEINELMEEADWPILTLSRLTLSGLEFIEFPSNVVVNELEQLMVSALTTPRGNRACADFLNRVESLQSKIDELRDITHEH